MPERELNRQLRKTLEKGFDDSFAAFCAEVFSSYQYSPENLAAARMHAFYLRFFLEEQVCGHVSYEEIPEDLREAFREICEQSIRETLSSGNPSGMECCRAFVRNWCEYHSSGKKP